MGDNSENESRLLRADVMIVELSAKVVTGGSTEASLETPLDVEVAELLKRPIVVDDDEVLKAAEASDDG